VGKGCLKKTLKRCEMKGRLYAKRKENQGLSDNQIRRGGQQCSPLFCAATDLDQSAKTNVRRIFGAWSGTP
jgi:hypothetical protein